MARQIRPAAESASNPIALIVDDNEDCCDIFSTFLTRVGFEVAIAATATEAFRLAVARPPDLVIVDVRLPGGPDGLMLTTKLRLDVRTTHVPIIVLTGDVLSATRARALAAGCDVYLTKPCPPDALVNHAQTLVSARLQERLSY
jgi:CheY-like chemotaxis protein